MAFLSSLITNLTISVHGKKGTKATELKDFMPNWDITAPKEIKKQGIEENEASTYCNSRSSE